MAHSSRTRTFSKLTSRHTCKLRRMLGCDLTNTSAAACTSPRNQLAFASTCKHVAAYIILPKLDVISSFLIRIDIFSDAVVPDKDRRIRLGVATGCRTYVL